MSIPAYQKKKERRKKKKPKAICLHVRVYAWYMMRDPYEKIEPG